MSGKPTDTFYSQKLQAMRLHDPTMTCDKAIIAILAQDSPAHPGPKSRRSFERFVADKVRRLWEPEAKTN